jgi:hypothetical protein
MNGWAENSAKDDLGFGYLAGEVQEFIVRLFVGDRMGRRSTSFLAPGSNRNDDARPICQVNATVSFTSNQSRMSPA